MHMKVVSTGSQANCYILDNNGRRLVLDAGVSVRNLLHAVNFDLASICAVLVTHEHGDHAKAVPELVDNGVNVIMTRRTKQAVLGGADSSLRLAICKDHDMDELIMIGSWAIKMFDVQHDAADPAGFLILNPSTTHKILYLTDSSDCRYFFVGLTHVIIECNFCTDIINTKFTSGQTNKKLRDRIVNNHMSLEVLLEFLQALDLSQCRKIILVHLSDVNSDAQQMIREVTRSTGVETIAAENGQVIDFNMFEF
jgi:phosphoribosyl 1,2-cyclic phosphodiesterase